jgi:DNA-binding MarR family transcriptional regulator
VPTSDFVEFDSLALEQQVCFALAITNRAVLGVYRPILAPLGVTHPQYLVMLALWDHHRDAAATGPMSVKQIASALQLEPATLSPMLKRLQAAGLISRTRNAADERGTDVTLTAAGVALRERALTVPPAVVERLGVQLSELELLRDVLSRVNAAAIAAGALDHPKP